MPLVESALPAPAFAATLPTRRPYSIMDVPEGTLRFEATRRMEKDPLVTVSDNRVSLVSNDFPDAYDSSSTTTSREEDTIDSTFSGGSSDEEAEQQQQPLDTDALEETPEKNELSEDCTFASHSAISTAISTDNVPPPPPKATVTRRRSLLKPASVTGKDDLCISSRKKVWMTLPPPHMDTILKRALSVDTAKTATISEAFSVASTSGGGGGGRKGVTFSKVVIREYDMTLGDNPSVSIGPPISLDWNYVEKEPLPLDDYEAERGPRRMLRQMMMNYYQRRNLLLHTYGHSEIELKKAEREATKIRGQRGMTRSFLQFSKIMDAVESTGRKTKRMVKGGKKKNKT